MIRLGRHIEILLLDNDCVIVPDFGGFVAHQVSARYDERDHTFLPPMRTLGFNPQLRINDSLLAQSYVTAYDLSYPEAVRRIEEEVDELKQVLSNEGHYTLADIGKLSVNDNGNYLFEPCEAGILSPEYYGLGGCHFLTLQEAGFTPLEEAEPKVPAPVSTNEATGPSLLEFTVNEGEYHDEDEEHTIKIKVSWIRNAMAMAAAIVAFFVMATPIANSDLNTSSMTQMQSQLLYRMMPQDTNVVPATPVADPLKSQAAPESNTNTAQPAMAHHPFCIVLASHVKMHNAERYIEQLKQEGYEAQVYIYKNVVRVVYGSYETEEEAYQQLRKINTKKGFNEAWVYKKKTEA